MKSDSTKMLFFALTAAERTKVADAIGADPVEVLRVSPGRVRAAIERSFTPEKTAAIKARGRRLFNATRLLAWRHRVKRVAEWDEAHGQKYAAAKALVTRSGLPMEDM